MFMAKIVYIIPGFGESVKLKGYQKIINSFKLKGFKPVTIKIDWNYKVLSDYVVQFLSQLAHKKSDKVYVLGFSYGALIAFITSEQVKPDIQFLCSLSPHFKEDLVSFKKSWKKYLGTRRINDLANFSFDKLSKTSANKTIMFMGTNEREKFPLFEKRVKLANKLIKNSELIEIESVDHNISQKEYYESVQKVISKL